MAEVIAKVLYPDDNHYEGKSLRLKQQYFFVSATVQSIVRKHRAQYGTLRNFHEKHVLQINDTHPTLVIPELMRILMDVEGYSWNDAWNIVTKSVAYTNHTVLAGCPRSTPSWTLWFGSVPAGMTTSSIPMPSGTWRSTRMTSPSWTDWRPSSGRTSAASPPMWPGRTAWC